MRMELFPQGLAQAVLSTGNIAGSPSVLLLRPAGLGILVWLHWVIPAFLPSALLPLISQLGPFPCSVLLPISCCSFKTQQSDLMSKEQSDLSWCQPCPR